MSIGFEWFQLEGEEPPPSAPTPVPNEVRISDSTTLLCLGGRFFNYLKGWLVDGNIYDKSLKAVPYTNSYVKFPGQAFTTSGNPSAGTDLIIHHRNLDYSTTYGVTVGADGEFSFHLKLGLGENRIWVTTADEQIVSNVLIYNAYYIHFFLCLYSLEFALFRKYYVQMRQNVSLRDYVFGDVPYPDLPSDEDYYTTEQKALVSNFARMLYLPTIPQMTREEFASAIRSVFSAFEISPMKEAVDLVSIALTGNAAVVFEYFKSHTFELDEEHDVKTIYHDFSWKLVAGTTYPTVSPGGSFCWGDNWFRLYNEKKFLVHGNKALSDIGGIPPVGSVWVYVDGEVSGSSLVMKYATDQPFPFANYYNESFTPDQVLVDADGSVTGLAGGLYVKTKYLPVQFDYGQDLADVDPDRTVDLTRAVVLSGQSIISLNLINMPVNTIRFYYYYNYEFVVLGRVFYTQDEGFFLITDIRRCSRISDKIEEGMVTANSSDSTYLVDTVKAWTRDQHLMDRVIFTSGGNKGEGRVIVTNDTTRIDIHPVDIFHSPFPFNPQIGDQYDILSRDFNGAFYLSTRGHQHLFEVYLNDLNLNKVLLRKVTRQVLRDLISLVIPAYKQGYIFFKRRLDAVVEVFSVDVIVHGQVRNISSNSSGKLIIKSAWSTLPSGSDGFGISYGGISYDSDRGTVSPGGIGTNWIIDNSKSYGSDQWVPGVIIANGTERRLVLSNTDRRITVWPNWSIVPTTYELMSIEDYGKVLSSGTDYINCVKWNTDPEEWGTNIFMSLPEGPGYYVDFEYYDKTYRPDRPLAQEETFRQSLFTERIS
jgi:hypothetical protein